MIRRRKEFGAPYKFSDRDAQEDPNIQQNDCRPYKDPNFETKRKEISVGMQAVAESADANQEEEDKRRWTVHPTHARNRQQQW